MRALLPPLLDLLVLGLLLLALGRLLRGPRSAPVLLALWWLLPLQALAGLARLLLASPGSVPAERALALPLQLPEPGAAAPAGASVSAWLLLVAALSACLLGRALLRSARLRRSLLARGRPAGPALEARLRASAARLGMRRRALPRLLLVPGFGPALLGARRPLLLLPGDAAGETALRGEELDHALLHELMHHWRRDALAAAAFHALAALLWFHPAAWWAKRETRRLRELCCDLGVAHVLGAGAPRYRRTLLRASARLHLGAALPPATLGLLGRGSLLLQRLDLLARSPRGCSPGTRLRALCFAALIAPLVLACGVEATHPPAAAVAPAVPDARAFFDRAWRERDRYGCFHRRYAWNLLQAERDAGSS